MNEAMKIASVTDGSRPGVESSKASTLQSDILNASNYKSNNLGKNCFWRAV